MLLHIARNTVSKLDGEAHILITLDTMGRPRMQSFFMGDQDATYGLLPDATLLGKELPKLLAELRSQIERGSRSWPEPHQTTQQPTVQEVVNA